MHSMIDYLQGGITCIVV